ncbi:MAG: c-type cytochrome [Hyphomicrobium sp.]
MLFTKVIPLTLILTSTLVVSVAMAQNTTVIKERKNHFKTMSDAVKPTGAMLKGEAPFDLAIVKKAIRTIEEQAPKLANLFPEDSKEGEKTQALPDIWSNKAEFEGRFKKLADAAKAAESSITDEVTFQEVWPQVTGNCGGCHKKYRRKEE